MELYPYLFFEGDCEEGFKFYEKVFDGKITSMTRFSESSEKGIVADEDQDNIMHASIVIAGVDLMGSDAPNIYYKKPQLSSLIVSLETSEEVERIFNALVENGEVLVELGENPWAHLFGSVVDRFGIAWMLSNLKML